MSNLILKKLFYHENYVVAYRFLNREKDTIGIKFPSYDIINPSGTSWYADPFPFIYQGKHYIFVEMYSIWDTKAKLGVYCIEDKGSPKTILDEPFHLSYPNVFEWAGEIYMIPETHNANQLRLYRCSHFPYNWELDRILLDNVDYADTSLMFEENAIWVETMEDRGQHNYSNRFFKLDMHKKCISEIHPIDLHFIDKRPAGNFFKVGNEWYHALQECSQTYGEYMHVARVSTFNDDVFREERCCTLTVSDFNIHSTLPFIRTHTLNRCKTLETIDLLYYKFSLFKPLARIWRMIKSLKS